jgi:hypothetical protein
MSSNDVLTRLAEDGMDKNKAISVTFFRHGMKTDKGKKYIWNMHHQFRTFEQMRIQLATDIPGGTGPVQKVFDMNGTRINTLEEILDKQKYICCGGENFTAAGIPLAAQESSHAVHHEPQQQQQQQEQEQDQPLARNRVNSDKDAESHRAKVCFFFGAKGQTVQAAKGAKFIMNPTKFKTVQQVIDEVSTKIGLVTGGIGVIYDLEGNALTSAADLVDQGRYICSIKKEFNKSMIPDAAQETVPPK